MATFRLKLQRPYPHRSTEPQCASVRVSPPGPRTAGLAHLWITDDDKGKGRGVYIDRWEALRISDVLRRYAKTGNVEQPR